MAANENKRPFSVAIGELNIQELSFQQQKLESDLAMLKESIQTLQVIKNKFSESKSSVEKMHSCANGEDNTLIPLSSSVYVKGKMADKDSFTIHIGTGYYVKKNAKGATEYFDRRLKHLNTEMEKVAGLLEFKRRMKEDVSQVLQQKIMAHLSSEGAGEPRASQG